MASKAKANKAARFTHQEEGATYTGICQYRTGDKVMAMVDQANGDFQMWSIDPSAVDAGLEELRRCYAQRQGGAGKGGAEIEVIHVFGLQRCIDQRR